MLKDYQTHQTIQSIPTPFYEKVKDFLDENNIVIYEQEKSINWNKFLTGVRKNFKGFV